MKFKSATKTKILEASELISDGAAFALVLIIVIYVSILSRTSSKLESLQKKPSDNIVKIQWFSSIFKGISDENIRNENQGNRETAKDIIAKDNLDDKHSNGKVEENFESLWENLLAAEPRHELTKDPTFIKKKEVVWANDVHEKTLKDGQETTLERFKRILQLVNRDENVNEGTRSKELKYTADSNSKNRDWSFLAGGNQDSQDSQDWSFMAPNADERGKL
jgi:hypothetical protein